MLFRNIIFSALLVGIIAGLVFSVIQQFRVSDIIYAAEKFESSTEQESHQHTPSGSDAMSGHHHDEEAWAPEDGAERIFYTVVANILSGIGYAIVLLSLMNLVSMYKKTPVSLLQGIVWGVAGYLSVFIAPSFGLHPEIPGMQAATLEARQIWWVFTVISSATGLGLLFYLTGAKKLFAVFFLLIPHLIGAPAITGSPFKQMDPEVVLQLTELHQQFLIATGVVNGIFWLLLGALSAWVLQKWSSQSINNH